MVILLKNKVFLWGMTAVLFFSGAWKRILCICSNKQRKCLYAVMQRRLLREHESIPQGSDHSVLVPQKSQ